MKSIIIEGGHRLTGDVSVSGAKNAALPIIAASILNGGSTTLHNVPGLMDIKTIIKLLRALGTEVEFVGDVMNISTKGIQSQEAPYELVKTMRASILVLGSLVARFKRARVSLPGGCAIGARPVDLHLKGLETLGASISLKDGYIEASADRLRGDRIVLDFPTVTGTENLMMAATLASGTTVIENAAREPEVVELGNFLVGMGARIDGLGSKVITVEGVESLDSTEHTIMPDRIEAGTFFAAAAITGGDVRVIGARTEHLGAAVEKMQEAGIRITPDREGVRVSAPDGIKPVSLKTQPYPGFPTDLQAQMMVLMTQAAGTSVITETIFEKRFMHIAELSRMGANITVEGQSAIIKGGARLQGAPVMATDLRASASLILAGLAAEGRTSVSRIYHLDRGYEAIEKKLHTLGARIERIDEDGRGTGS